jgi:hypothetical protein
VFGIRPWELGELSEPELVAFLDYLERQAQEQS